jgi:NAD(P)-dependent dehydrogenase (short-subunit alcohol dehydrogenase family)
MKLDGKVAVVTGSGNGIGEAIARRFAAEGARVVVTDIEPAAVERVADAIGTVGMAADITAPASVRAVAELARETYGEVDVWLSNAGVAGPRQPGDLQDDSLWDLMWRLHVLSHLHAAREVLPSMIARGDGYLLQTASSVALSTQPEKLAYSVTKQRGARARRVARRAVPPAGDQGLMLLPGADADPDAAEQRIPQWSSRAATGAHARTGGRCRRGGDRGRAFLDCHPTRAGACPHRQGHRL